VEEAMRNSPELRQLDRAIQAQERVLLASERAFYVPTFSFFGEVSYLVGFGEGTESGFEAPPDLPFALSFPEADDLNWTLGVAISYDLFNGGGRQADQRRAEEQLIELRTRRDFVATRVEQGVRSALHEAGASYAGIALAREAAEAARQGEELVSEAYESGLANITDLLDAQNQALVADLVAASAVYEYLIDYIAAQRAVGRFDMLMSDDERADLIERLEAELGQAE
jgi:outer membrane protein TolC